MQLVDWLKNLTVRFLINLPHSELTSVSRLCFQVEEAQWYYEDFVRPLEAASGNILPHLSLKEFSLLIFKSCPLTNSFTEEQHIAAYETFLAYKVRVPVRGAILLDESMERAVLVRGWKKGANWSFPRGKINKDEKDLTCAIREVYEETGFDIRAAGLVPQDEDQTKYIDVTMREQHMRLFVFRNVPLDTHFEPRTRKEISKIEWYNLRDLPGYSKKHKGAHHDPAHEALQANKFYMVAPFLGPLKKWIAQQRRNEAGLSTDYTPAVESDYAQTEEVVQSNDGKSAELRNLLNIGSTPSPAARHIGLPPPNVQPSFQQHTPQPYDNTQVRPQQYPPHLQHMFGYAANQHPSPPQFAQQGPPRDQFLPVSYPHGHHPGIQHHPHGIPAHLQGNMAFPQQHHPAQPSMHGILTPPGLQGFQTQTQGQGQGYPQPQQQFARPQSIHASHDEPSAMLAAPKASELPAPKLNAHSLRLLQAFKQGPPQTGSATATQPGQQTNAHQTRLLDLFRSPTQTPTPAAVSTPIDSQQAIPLVIAPRPAELQDRQTTLNEYTRTLPIKSRTSSQQSTSTPPQTQSAVPPSKKQEAPIHEQHVPIHEQHVPIHEQHAPVHGQHAPRAQKSTESKKTTTHDTQPQLLQRPQGRKHAASYDSRQANQGTTGHKQTRSKNAYESPKQPSFTILTRPASKENSPASPSFPPQLLKRAPGETQEPSKEARVGGTSTNGVKTQQQDHLLALFGGATVPNASKPKTPEMPSSPLGRSPIESGRPVSILRHSSPSTQPVEQIPAATSITAQPVPEQISSKPTTTQTNLLDLFKLNSAMSNASTASTLSKLPGQLPATRDGQAVAERRPDTKAQRQSSNAATPTETKSFLLGFLNDVVQKEGRAT